MTFEEFKKTNEYNNIHHTLNCIFKKFKFKLFCKLNKHNYIMSSKYEYGKIYMECYCCGKEVELEDDFLKQYIEKTKLLLKSDNIERSDK